MSEEIVLLLQLNERQNERNAVKIIVHLGETTSIMFYMCTGPSREIWGPGAKFDLGALGILYCSSTKR